MRPQIAPPFEKAQKPEKSKVGEGAQNKSLYELRTKYLIASEDYYGKGAHLSFNNNKKGGTGGTVI